MNAKQSAGLALVVALVGGACGAGVRAEGREVVFVCEHGAAKSVLARTLQLMGMMTPESM